MPKADKHLCLSHTSTWVLEICSRTHRCCSVSLSLARSLYKSYDYLFCNWANVKTKGFCRLGHLSKFSALYARLKDVTIGAQRYSRLIESQLHFLHLAARCQRRSGHRLYFWVRCSAVAREWGRGLWESTPEVRMGLKKYLFLTWVAIRTCHVPRPWESSWVDSGGKMTGARIRAMQNTAVINVEWTNNTLNRQTIALGELWNFYYYT